MTLEREIEFEVQDWAEQNGWHVRPLEYRGRRGCPDRIFFGHGTIRLIEFKKPGGRLSGNQRREIKRFREAGIEVPVIDTVDAGIAFLRRFM